MTKSEHSSDPALGAPFAALRDALHASNTPPAVEQALMDAFARRFAPRRWYHALSPRQWGVAGGVGTTALVAAMSLMLSLSAPPPADQQAAPAIDEGAEFIALESAERIEQEADAQLVRTNVPRAALASLGVPVTPQNAGEAVRAEMLVGADGAPLALRLVSLP
ncbi:MAG: hypothetical protein H7335_06535 [Massilia sp.]|nr:hypothetical protein [Massilia sp.]